MSRKEIEEIKAKIYQQVEKLEDETALQMLEEAVVAYTKVPKVDIIDELTSAQHLRLKDSIQQAKDGRTLSNDEVNQKAKGWLSR